MYLWFHVLYETGLTPKSNVTEIFERNFMPINGRQYNSRTHHRRNKNNTINYYTPDITRFKQWINQRLPPDEGEIVDILTLQDYIQCVILAMFHEDFPNEKQKPALFYTSICYLGWRSSMITTILTTNMVIIKSTHQGGVFSCCSTKYR